MKLAFSTLGCPDWRMEQILDAATRLGYQGVELRGVQGGMEPGEIACLQGENRGKTLRAFADCGIELCVYGTSVHFHDPETLEQHYQKALQALWFCADCSIPMMRIFGNEVQPETEQAQLDQIARTFDKLCREAERLHVQPLLEVHGNLTTIERLRYVAERVDSPTFGIIWDVGHTHAVYGTRVDTFYQALKPWIRHVHMKDAIHENGRLHHLCAVGQGHLPLRQIVKMLEEDGYPGYYSLEWEKRWHPELEEPEIVFPAYTEWMNRGE
ncbi:MAG: sugar phosphate isomerase/epimerase [Clostridia bacterium]|nr:sugar phosphate isomerase/epimerase [Clostridia bacterium]